MFENHKNLKFNNNLKHKLKFKIFVKWSFQRLETGWRDCWELRKHIESFWKCRNNVGVWSPHATTTVSA